MQKYSNENKEIRYAARDEIEQIIKAENIDREHFKEAAKDEYDKIIRKFYYTFCDYKNYPKIHLNYVWLNFRKTVTFREPVRCDDWEKYIDNIDILIPNGLESEEYFLITDYGWVYEGRLAEIKKVLKETTAGCFDDFYILPKRSQFDWVICHCDDGDCMVNILAKGNRLT